ncbi:alpha/beta hydrolase fold domain-containing protein [Candidatus Hydrogenedentota bacterium]
MGEQEIDLTGIRVETDVPYGKGSDRTLLLDVFRPENAEGPLPGLVCIHGGGWRNGSKEQPRPIVTGIAKRGFVCVSIMYRLSAEAVFPAAFEDSKCAVRWFRANAERLGVDPERIGAMGFSAGGTLTALLGVTNGIKEFEGTGGNEGVSSDVQAALNFFGPTDMLEMGLSGRADNAAGLWIGADPREDPGAFLRASPLSYVSKNSVPFLFWHGTEDALVPLEHSTLMKDALKKVGVHAEMFPIDGLGHGFMNRDDLRESAVGKVEDFCGKFL